jgi:hypothetical protein
LPKKLALLTKKIRADFPDEQGRISRLRRADFSGE